MQIQSGVSYRVVWLIQDLIEICFQGGSPHAATSSRWDLELIIIWHIITNCIILYDTIMNYTASNVS